MKGIPSVTSSTHIADQELALQRPAKRKTTLGGVPKRTWTPIVSTSKRRRLTRQPSASTTPHPDDLLMWLDILINYIALRKSD
jgi:hypothetical protein